MLAVEHQRLVAIGGFRHDLHLGNSAEQGDEALADDVMVIDNEQSHGFGGDIR
jgi:hypothetical protein